MFAKHYDRFNDAINAHGLSADRAEHESVLYHESRMYELAKEYVRRLDELTSREVDDYLRFMRHHVCAVLAYVGLSADPDPIMFEMLDVQSE